MTEKVYSYTYYLLMLPHPVCIMFGTSQFWRMNAKCIHNVIIVASLLLLMLLYIFHSVGQLVFHAQLFLPKYWRSNHLTAVLFYQSMTKDLVPMDQVSSSMITKNLFIFQILYLRNILMLLLLILPFYQKSVWLECLKPSFSQQRTRLFFALVSF